MALKLRIISEQYQQLGKQSTRLFGVTGGRIGRSADNDWILPDPDRYISSHHAVIRHQAGQWLIEDTSTNGVFINGAEIPLSQHGPYQLNDGDHVRMGDYDLLVSIDPRADFPPDASGQLPAPPVRKTKNAKRTEHEDLGAEIDINALLSGDVSEFAPTTGSTGRFEVGNAFGVDVKHQTPRVSSAAGSTPTLTVADVYEDIPLSDSFTEKPSLPTPPPNASGAPGDEWHLRTRRLQKNNLSVVGGSSSKDVSARIDTHSDLHAGIEALCRGAGIDPASLPNEMQAATLNLAGQMLRESILGLMEALKNRGEFKGKFDPSQTSSQAIENNPLKTSVSVDDALRKLMDSHNSRHLGPVEALRDAFTDLRTHQLAVTAAMHAGLNGLMQRINPAELQERFDRGLKRGALLGAANKMKYWDLYAEFFQALNQRNADGMPSTFAEEFVQAYTERSAGFKTPKKK